MGKRKKKKNDEVDGKGVLYTSYREREAKQCKKKIFSLHTHSQNKIKIKEVENERRRKEKKKKDSGSEFFQEKPPLPIPFAVAHSSGTCT